MKSKLRIRLLSIFSFILLIAPFYDSCNGNRMMKTSELSEAVADLSIDEIDSIQFEVDDSKKKACLDSIIENKSVLTDVYEFIDDNDSESALEFASFNSTYFDQTFDEFAQSVYNGINKKDFKGFFFGLKNLSFLFIVVITLLVIIFSFSDKIRLQQKFILANLTFLVITIFCIFLEGLFETIYQIKWGYYIFIIIQISLFYFLNKHEMK